MKKSNCKQTKYDDNTTIYIYIHKFSLVKGGGGGGGGRHWDALAIIPPFQNYFIDTYNWWFSSTLQKLSACMNNIIKLTGKRIGRKKRFV